MPITKNGGRVQVKFFRAPRIEVLESRLNDFLERTDGSFVDIKFHDAPDGSFFFAVLAYADGKDAFDDFGQDFLNAVALDAAADAVTDAARETGHEHPGL